MTKQQISEFESLQGQMESLHTELTTLLKKNPSDLLNKFKLGLINSVLLRSNEFLGEPRKPFKDFDKFDTDALPSNSDVLLVVGQYLSSFENLRADNVYLDDAWYWWTTDETTQKLVKSYTRTAPPKKISQK